MAVVKLGGGAGSAGVTWVVTVVPITSITIHVGGNVGVRTDMDGKWSTEWPS